MYERIARKYVEVGAGSNEIEFHRGNAEVHETIADDRRVIVGRLSRWLRPPHNDLSKESEGLAVLQKLRAKIDYVDLGADSDRDIVTFISDDPRTEFSPGEIGIIQNFDPAMDVIRLPAGLSSYMKNAG